MMGTKKVLYMRTGSGNQGYEGSSPGIPAGTYRSIGAE